MFFYSALWMKGIRGKEETGNIKQVNFVTFWNGNIILNYKSRKHQRLNLTSSKINGSLLITLMEIRMRLKSLERGWKTRK